ncbi:hypothetical protein GGR57DRAFT_506326 [Xylariaceae sp. FL1272]|nr:hypothetical protein GGR57DRAFT_506326 [Xylariaceae sp. FL1272]
MASSSIPVAHQALAFGLELEFLLRPKPHTVSQLTQKGWDVNIKSNEEMETRKDKNGTIMRKEIADGIWRVEIVSRVFGTEEKWQLEVDAVFEALRRGWDTCLTQGCAMHIHVSRGIEKKYTIADIRRILKWTALEDDAITKIMPPHRKNNAWAASNFRSEEAPEVWSKHFKAIGTDTFAPLFKEFDNIKFLEMVYRATGEKRNLSWNFSNLGAQCGTIVFRQPPSVETAAGAEHWVGVTIGFMAHALNTDPDEQKH